MKLSGLNAIITGANQGLGLEIARHFVREGANVALCARDVAKLSDLQRGKYCDHFFFEDPAGYAIEIQRFHNPDIATLFR